VSEPRESLEDRFAARLRQLEKDGDRATLAQLRRGLGKSLGFAAERDGWVIARVPPTLPDPALEAYCLTASLFALHPQAGGAGSLAASFASWHDQERQRLGKAPGERLDNIDRRFAALLHSDREDLPDRLRRAVALLKAHEVPVHWAQLLRDVQFWDHPRRRVQVRWSRDFWAGVQAGDQASEQPAPETNPTAVS
jgi:CRISPR system Cascade subunit CasB